MNVLDNRVKTFKAARGKKAWSLKSKFLSAKFLSQIGFYHTPSKGKPNVVTCSCCNTAIDWTEYDHPLQCHIKETPCDLSRLWGAIQGNQDWSKVINHEETDQDLQQLAIATFTSWPYNQKSDQKQPTAIHMAESGFIYLPMENSNDHAICPYCEVSLDGWDTNDDAL